MHEFFPENYRNPARDHRAGAMRQFPTGQVYSRSLESHKLAKEASERLQLAIIGVGWGASIARSKVCDVNITQSAQSKPGGQDHPPA
jgi:hypothetical protein